MSGNGNHGTVNGATLGTDRHGVAGKAYSFDGDDWIVSENNFSIIGNNSRTFNVWWKSGYSDKSFALISSGVGEVETGFEILSKQKPVVHWFGTGRNLSSGEIIAEKWHFISASYDGQKIRLYLDSKYLTQKDASLDTAENSLLIGRPRFDSHFYALGLIDDIRIYDRALSEDEIELLTVQRARTICGFCQGLGNDMGGTGHIYHGATDNKLN